MAVATLKMLTLDSADARRDAEFWSEALGWKIVHAQDEYAMLTGPDHALGFGTIPDYQAPTWPNENGTKLLFSQPATPTPHTIAKTRHRPAPEISGARERFVEPAR